MLYTPVAANSAILSVNGCHIAVVKKLFFPSVPPPKLRDIDSDRN